MDEQRLTSFTSEGLTFDVRDAGPADGPVVIALHGFPQTSASWSGVTPLLTAAGYRVLAPDQRGYSPGARPRSIAAYTMGPLCRDVLALADAAGVGRFHVIGHDWGAAVAWALAGTQPERVQTLTAVSVPHPAAFVRSMAGSQALRSWYMAFFQLPVLPELLFRVRQGAGLRPLLRAIAHPDPDAAVRLLADPRTATGAVNWYRALRKRSGLALGPVRVPTLYVWSDRDPALGRRAAEDTATWVRAPYRFEVFSGASHWIPEEHPAELAALVLEHLRVHATG
jgi:pimeloyl-ACP methyl ester carboxylesterase